MVRDYWRPSSATLELGWGPEAEGDLAQLKLSMVDSPLRLLDGWEILSLMRAEGALTAKAALSQPNPTGGTHNMDARESIFLPLADGQIWRWVDLGSALRRLIHVLPRFADHQAGQMPFATRAYKHGVWHYEEYEFWHCECCDEIYSQEWLSCPICRRLSRQFFRRPS